MIYALIAFTDVQEREVAAPKLDYDDISQYISRGKMAILST
jgi:hypothetical protein